MTNAERQAKWRNRRNALAKMAKAPRDLETLTRQFCIRFAAEMYDHDQQEQEWSIQLEIVHRIFSELRKRRGGNVEDERELRELFADYAPRKPRAESQRRREQLAWFWGRSGKPRKKTFAYNMARLNTEKRGLVGTGTTDGDNMYDYFKKTLGQKRYRDEAEDGYALYLKQRRRRG
jgi:hypothetical protein